MYTTLISKINDGESLVGKELQLHTILYSLVGSLDTRSACIPAVWGCECTKTAA